MISRTQVAICGSCLYMACLASGLQKDPALDVVHAHSLSLALSPASTGPAPSVVAFNLAETPRDAALSLLGGRPNLLLVGVEPGTDEMLVLSSGRRTTVRSLDEFRDLIDARPAGKAVR